MKATYTGKVILKPTSFSWFFPIISAGLNHANLYVSAPNGLLLLLCGWKKLLSQVNVREVITALWYMLSIGTPTLKKVLYLCNNYIFSIYNFTPTFVCLSCIYLFACWCVSMLSVMHMAPLLSSNLANGVNYLLAAFFQRSSHKKRLLDSWVQLFFIFRTECFSWTSNKRQWLQSRWGCRTSGIGNMHAG